MEFRNINTINIYTVLFYLSRRIDEEKLKSNTLFNYFSAQNMIVLKPFVEGIQTTLKKGLSEEDRKRLQKWETDRSAIKNSEDEIKFNQENSDFNKHLQEINKVNEEILNLTNNIELRTIELKFIPDFVTPNQLIILDKLINKE